MPASELASDVRALAASLGSLPGPVTKPILVVLSGLPGTGKSYFAARLAERQPFAILESDSLRRALFPRPGYTQQESTRLFEAVHRLTWRLLTKGISVILDATNVAEKHRQPLYAIARRTGARLVLVQVEAPIGLVRQRLEARKAAGGGPDADWWVYLRMRRTFEPIKSRHYTVDTSGDITPVLDRIMRALRR
jgi:predicted kinase